MTAEIRPGYRKPATARPNGQERDSVVFEVGRAINKVATIKRSNSLFVIYLTVKS